MILSRRQVQICLALLLALFVAGWVGLRFWGTEETALDRLMETGWVSDRGAIRVLHAMTFGNDLKFIYEVPEGMLNWDDNWAVDQEDEAERHWIEPIQNYVKERLPSARDLAEARVYYQASGKEDAWFGDVTAFKRTGKPVLLIRNTF